MVSAGASALRPLVEVVGIHNPGDQALRDGVQRAINVSNAAIRANFTGPLVSAATLVLTLYCAFIQRYTDFIHTIGTATGDYIVFAFHTSDLKPGRVNTSSYHLPLQFHEVRLPASISVACYRTS